MEAQPKKSRLMFWMVLLSIWLLLLIGVALFTMADKGSGDPTDPVRERLQAMAVETIPAPGYALEVSAKELGVIRVQHTGDRLSAALTVKGTVARVGGADNPASRRVRIRFEALSATNEVVGEPLVQTLMLAEGTQAKAFELGTLTLLGERIEKTARLVVRVEPARP